MCLRKVIVRVCVCGERERGGREGGRERDARTHTHTQTRARARAQAADVPKNQTANVFTNHCLPVAESTENQKQLYVIVQILYMISANKQIRARPVCHPRSLRFGARQIHIEIGKQNIVWSGWSKQSASKTLIAMHNRLAYIYF